VPKDKLERANQLSQLMTYGTALIAALVFAVFGWLATALGHVAPFAHTNKVDLALYFNGASYFVSAITVYFLRQIGKRNLRCNLAAIREAERIRKMNSAAARWIAADALRELSSEAVQKRLRQKSLRDARRNAA